MHNSSDTVFPEAATLTNVSDETYETASKMFENGQTEAEARIEHLEQTLDAVRTGMKEIVPQLFRIHPDDLTV